MLRIFQSSTSLILCAVMVLSTAGCRLPKSFLRPPETTLFYDTAYEQELIGKSEPDRESLEYDFKWRYRDSLAEPVTVVAYEEDVSSKWQILFATNRTPLLNQQTQTVRYKNGYSESLHYGQCFVTLTEPTEEELAAARPDGFVGKVVDALPKPWQQEIVFKEDKYTSVEEVSPLADQDFFKRLTAQIAASRQKDVLIFVHGFNVDFKSSVSRLAQISRDMPFNGAIVAYSWPSQGGVKNYEQDSEIIDDSIAPFVQFLNDLEANLPETAKVNIVVHSMGNRLVMRSLSRLDDLRTGKPLRFENVVYCAPDVGVEEFKRLAPLTMPHAKRTTLYRCLNDTALIVSSYKNGEERAGGSLAPVIIDGLETIECAAIDTSILGHSYYSSNSHMLRDLFSIVKENKSAAERPWMKKQKIPFQGEYWIISDWPVHLEWAWHFNDSPTNIVQVGYETDLNKTRPDEE